MLEHLKVSDFGTPKRESEQEVTLEIDGNPVTVPKGTSLMRAAVDAGIKVPKLCATDSLEPFGSCRLCLVEIDGRKGFPASCTTPAETGTSVLVSGSLVMISTSRSRNKRTSETNPPATST